MASGFQQQLRWFRLGNISEPGASQFSVSLLRCSPLALSTTYFAHPRLWDVLDSWPDGQGPTEITGADWMLAPLNEQDANSKLASLAVRTVLRPLYLQIRDREAELLKDVAIGGPGSLANSTFDGSLDTKNTNASKNIHTVLRIAVLDRLLATCFSGPTQTLPMRFVSQTIHGPSQVLEDARMKKHYEAAVKNHMQTIANFCDLWLDEEKHQEQSAGLQPLPLTEADVTQSLLTGSENAFRSKVLKGAECNIMDAAVALRALMAVSSDAAA